LTIYTQVVVAVSRIKAYVASSRLTWKKNNKVMDKHVPNKRPKCDTTIFTLSFVISIAVSYVFVTF